MEKGKIKTIHCSFYKYVLRVVSVGKMTKNKTDNMNKQTLNSTG